MATLLDPKTPARLVLDERAGKALLFKVPTVVDGPLYERAVIAAGGKRWSLTQRIHALADGVNAILEGEEHAAERLPIVAELQALELQAAEVIAQARTVQGLDDEQRVSWLVRLSEIESSARLAEIEAVVAPRYPRYNALLADNQVYSMIRGIAAAKLFLVGWEGIKAPVERTLEGVSESTLAHIPRRRFAEIGAFVDGMLAPTEDEAGNSESPSPGLSAATTSTAASKPPRTARSRKTAGRSRKSG